MNSTFSDAFEADLLTVTRVQDPPTDAVGWGSDLSCMDDLTEDVQELDGTDPRVVAQAVYRRITTPRGSLLDDPDYGDDITRFLSLGNTPAQLASIAGELHGEIAKDDRVDTVECTADYAQGTKQLNVSIDVTLVDSTETFSLTIAVDSDGTNLVEMLINGTTVA